MKTENMGQAAFDSIVGGGGYSSLTEGGKDAFRAFARLDAEITAARGLVDVKTQARWKGAMQACLDAVRDARSLGLFDAGRP